MKRVEDMNYYELLDISPDASPKQVQEAYLLSVATYGEDSIASYIVISDDEKKKMLSRIEVAYRNLSNMVKRNVYNEEVLKLSPLPAISSDELPPPKLQSPSSLATSTTESSHKTTGDRSFFNLKWPFGKKKVKIQETTEPTIDIDGQIDLSGAYLKNVREVKGITLKEVSKNTRIKMLFLEAIEEDNESEFPEKIFLHGFIKTYSKYLDLDPEQFSKNYRFR